MHAKYSRYPDLTLIGVEQGLLRAQVIKAKLESSGIPVLLEYESLGPIIGITIDGLGEVQMFVRNEDVALARSLIEDQVSAEDAELENESVD